MPDSFEIKERQFESDIEQAMSEKGWMTVDSKTFNEGFDRELGLHPEVFLEFIKKSQPKAWQKYKKISGTKAEEKLIERLNKVIHNQGILKTIREGFKDRGIHFTILYRKPESSLNQTAVEHFNDNIFQVVRQLHYSPKNENSIDIVLFINGIPLVSMELKCQFTGQTVDNAVTQYKFDRSGKEKIFTFKERVLVHFAVDLNNVYMTTKLDGANTFFLPFNQGSNGAGNVGGQGNPKNENGYDTDYLWNEVLTPERLSEILFKYLHLQEETDENGKSKSKMIFPRYHQLDVVTKLLEDVKENGPGKNYLIEHSAGSGKSNSIAWLAHRLSGFHDDNDQKIFDSIIIVTDRKVLDQQLQNTVYQFDHQPGVVKKIDKNSAQLRDAIEDGTPIIISTLQKFPVIYKEVEAKDKNFAIIVDEAHSSQTGNAAKKLKFALADTEKILEEWAQEEEIEEENKKDLQDQMMETLAAQGKQDNLSFFAFTATPKNKTLEIFGTEMEDGSFHPFHIYSMRQAIEEGFILDVLQNYMTYKMYYQIAKSIKDNPDMDEAAGVRAVTNFETLHPHNISQKVKVMLEQFAANTSHKIGGRAKAMVITPSRLHAVRYAKEFKRQIKEMGLDEKVLVAFSGEIEDGGLSFTEEKMNVDEKGHSIPSASIPAEFHKDDYSMLIVAEKYQTGFDEPLLHTLFVDRKLSGVKAVQTLSRVNRIYPGKIDTFILDFVNSPEDILKAFQDYYEEAYLEEGSDPNLAVDLMEKLLDFQIISKEDYERFADIYYEKDFSEKDSLGRLQSTLQNSINRYNELTDKEKRETFKTYLNRFNRFYNFISQINRDFDKELHKFSLYAKYLAKFLPKTSHQQENVNDKVLLEFYKLEKDFDGSLKLEKGKSNSILPASGATGKREKELSNLAAIIEKINDKYGTEFTQMDKVMLQVKEDFLGDRDWSSVAQTNNWDTFFDIAKKPLMDALFKRYQSNEEFFNTLFSKEDIMEDLQAGLLEEIYNTIK